jgi:hypothetical protein
VRDSEHGGEGGRWAATLRCSEEEQWWLAGRGVERHGGGRRTSASAAARSRCSGREESESGDFCFLGKT